MLKIMSLLKLLESTHVRRQSTPSLLSWDLQQENFGPTTSFLIIHHPIIQKCCVWPVWEGCLYNYTTMDQFFVGLQDSLRGYEAFGTLVCILEAKTANRRRERLNEQMA